MGGYAWTNMRSVFIVPVIIVAKTSEAAFLTKRPGNFPFLPAAKSFFRGPSLSTAAKTRGEILASDQMLQ